VFSERAPSTGYRWEAGLLDRKVLVVVVFGRSERDALIRKLRDAGWSLRRIGRHEDVQLSAAAVHAILHSGKNALTAEEVAEPARPLGDGEDRSASNLHVTLEELRPLLRGDTRVFEGMTKLSLYRIPFVDPELDGPDVVELQNVYAGWRIEHRA
jgi:hypothetical protein